MPQDTSSETDDESLVLRMMDRDEDALRIFVAAYGRKIRPALKRRYRGVLAEPEIDAAMNWAAYKAYESIERFDADRSSLGSWFYTIAVHAAQDIVKGENRNRYQLLDVDPFQGDASHQKSGTDDRPDASSRQTRALTDVIDQKLTPGERRVILADLAAGGEADAARLAEEVGSTVASIFALRSKGRSKIRQFMNEQGHVQNLQRSKK